ncbi:porin [Myxococcus llanfairpwllgwyngyllgogerychwyrndrobwllllantysiliogogogochensis]|uniref:Porin n=1 Tax=Myxococcus llanfairpwllgwyngyllgogerychwyrndrobwllllantysiliogogogochensis TaxID=2590453 RepID=A0A540X7H4_9BACT|nr:porin [Myxococcus llanfairpwllgwyngyllgogerychwyrndrobwllllantysiliogogogochensis]TQF16654.1 porin [Myxococcus llanfairpwllgwyngyllgogerychwyrndrobwllllantysiliogogogochensis]
MWTLDAPPLLLSLLLQQADASSPPLQGPTDTRAEAEAPGFFSRMKPEGGVDVYFGHNFNRPANAANFIPGTGTSAKRDSEVAINLASIGVSVAPAPVGFKVLLGFGTGAEVVHAAEPEGVASGPDLWRYVQQASLSFATGPLTLEAGLYPSHIGLESFQSQLNWTYTRSWMGELSPYYQTGLKGTYALDDAWSVQLQLLNGWQTIGDNNRGLALGTQVAYAGERLSASFNTFIGNEGTEGSDGLRLFADAVATYAVTESFKLAATVDAGTQRIPGADRAVWYAAGLNARVQLAEPAALAARVEAYRDADGLMTGVEQTLTGGTLTLEVKPAEQLTLKLEARHDRSTADVFASRATTDEGTPIPKDSETLIVLGATAWF